MPPVFKGKDDHGNSIGNNITFWKAVKEGAKAPDGKPLWYKKGIDYWDNVEATDDGVLGGYGHVSKLDAKENTEFLEATFGEALEAKRTGSRKLVACDCGAGIGRVTSSFLIHQFDEVDLVVRDGINFFFPFRALRVATLRPLPRFAHVSRLCALRCDSQSTRAAISFLRARTRFTFVVRFFELWGRILIYARALYVTIHPKDGSLLSTSLRRPRSFSAKRLHLARTATNASTSSLSPWRASTRSLGVMTSSGSSGVWGISQTRISCPSSSDAPEG